MNSLSSHMPYKEMKPFVRQNSEGIDEPSTNIPIDDQKQEIDDQPQQHMHVNVATLTNIPIDTLHEMVSNISSLSPSQTLQSDKSDSEIGKSDTLIINKNI